MTCPVMSVSKHLGEEIRNPMAEGRRKAEIRRPDRRSGPPALARLRVSEFGFRSWFGLRISAFGLGLLLATWTLTAVSGDVAPGQRLSGREQEHKSIGVLKSNAPPAEKAMACKELAVCGTKDAVPALASLLADPELASWARIALEAIPGPAPDAALRKAMGRLQGKLLVGVINSIGVRRDGKAVRGLGKKLGDKDAEVASAAAVALGRIGGADATHILEHALARGPATALPAIAQGCILCAEQCMAQGQRAHAIRLYDAVRQAVVPRERVLEATRGAILARQADGTSLLLVQLRSPDKAFFGLGLQVARELPGLGVTDALVAELARCSPERQPLLLGAIADRKDAASWAAVLEAAKAGPASMRIVAISALERQEDASHIPVLLDAAASPENDVARAALGALTRWPGSDVDSAVLRSLPESSGKARVVLIDVSAKRQFEGALPAIVSSADSPDADVRHAAVQAIGVLGTSQEVSRLIELAEHTQNSVDRADLETALVAIASRAGSACVPELLPLTQAGEPALRISALHVLASAGGPAALKAVVAAIDDSDASVQDEAVRTLSTWPNNWPEDSGVADPMLRLARYGSKPSYQVLALRGYLQYVQGDKQLKADAKVEAVREVLALVKRPEDQRLAIATISSAPTASALEMLLALAAEPAVADDAYSAACKLAGDKDSKIAKEPRRHALQTVAEKATDTATRTKAAEALKAM
ncbi:MAG TPA: HEAT repeat domain-containing protein [Candidatus Acidoferrum sp.]|nr:HEAT repeat domain-containing protein [Candidatus Acidoferrum sp.]